MSSTVFLFSFVWRNKSLQKHAFDPTRDHWMRQLEFDAELEPMSREALLRAIRLCYEAKVPSQKRPSSHCDRCLTEDDLD